MKRTSAVTKHFQKLEEIKDFFENLREKKQESFDSKSEKWQESAAADDAQNDIDGLETIVSALEDLSCEIDSVFEVED